MGATWVAAHGRIKQQAKGDFDGNIALELVIDGAIDRTKASFTEHGDDAISTKRFGVLS